MFFAMEANGDVVYAEADNEDAAFDMLCSTFGAMPRDIVSIKERDCIPDDADIIE